MWQGLQTITDYKGKHSRELPSDTSLPDELNYESVIPTCFKQTAIGPVPKNTKVTCLNDYRPIALTSVAMKYFERLVMAHINTIIPETLDPSNLHTAPTDPQMMQSLLHSTLPFPTCTKETPM